MSPDDLNNQALVLWGSGKPEDAGRAWDQALQADSQHLESTYNRALLQWRSGEIDDVEILRRLSEARTVHCGFWRVDVLSAQVHLERGDAESAVHVLAEALVTNPGVTQIRSELERARAFLPRAGRSVRTFEGNDERIGCICLTDDGRLALTSARPSTPWDSGGKKLKLWDVATGRCLKILDGHTESADAVCLSQDGRFALSGTRNPGILAARRESNLKLWDVASGRCLRNFKRAGKVTSLSLSQDGRWVIAGDWNETLQLWNVDTGRLVRKFHGHAEAVNAVCLSRDGRRALSGSGYASTGDDNTLKLWEVEYPSWWKSWFAGKSRCLRTFEGHTRRVNCVSLSRDGRQALSGSMDKTLKLWDVETGRQIRTFDGHQYGVESFSWSGDGGRILSEGVTLRLWETSTGKCLRTFDNFRGPACLSQDGRWAIVCRENHSIELWEVGEFLPAEFAASAPDDSSEARERQFKSDWKAAGAAANQNDFVSAAHSLRSARSLAGYRRRREVLDAWGELYRHLPRGRFVGAWQQLQLAGHTGAVNSVTLSRDGRYALSGSDDKTLKLWELTAGRCVMTFEGHAEWVYSVCLSEDGRRALSGSRDKTLKWWDVETGRCLRTLEGHLDGVHSVCLSRDGRWAVSGSGEVLHSQDTTLKLWDLDTGRCMRTFEGHVGSVNSVALSSDCRRILSGSSDIRIHWWDANTGECLVSICLQPGSINSVCLSEDGRSALTGSGGFVESNGARFFDKFGAPPFVVTPDQILKLWDLPTGDCLQTFVGHTGAVSSVGLSQDGRFVISGSRDATVRLWEAATGHCLRTFEGHAGDVNSVDLSHDARWALSGGEDRTIRLWFLDWELEDRVTGFDQAT
jgi:WD40 repeat protein